MSSIITDRINCPQCGLPAQKDEYFVVDEEQVICHWCGYTHIRNAHGIHAGQGYGSAHYATKNENGSNLITQIMHFKAPLTLAQRQEIIMHIKEHCDTEHSAMYVWDEIEGKLECLLGTKPLTLEEEYRQQSEALEYYRQLTFADFIPEND
jgi:hypothetical protein